jgi:hypothetical protein
MTQTWLRKRLMRVQTFAARASNKGRRPSFGRLKRHARPIAVLFTMSSASAMAGNEVPNVSDEQMACAGVQEYETAEHSLNAQPPYVGRGYDNSAAPCGGLLHAMGSLLR